MTENNIKIPLRSEVKREDCWDLSKLFKDEIFFDEGLKELEIMMNEVESFKGTLGKSAQNLRECLDFNNKINLLMERLGVYAELRTSEDGSDSKHQGRLSKFTNIATKCDALASYQTPEIMAIPDNVMEEFLNSKILSEFTIMLRKILRFKPHVLNNSEEKLLAMQAIFAQTADNAFGALTDVDMNFGEIETPEGKKPLTQSSYYSFLVDKDRKIRKEAFLQFMNGYDSHKHTISELYKGSVQLDVYKAKVRNFDSSISSALFRDDVPLNVYDNLIESVSNNLPSLHKYYEIRRKTLGLDELHIYDTKVPLVSDIKIKHTYDEATNLVLTALAPLGDEYKTVLKNGLLGGWTDRYENKGKRSGAFSAGSFAGDPYILLNYKHDMLNDVFTLAHEAGHSMHSWYSVKSNPFQHYDYTIFAAEVASTFNEQLLFKYMLEQTDDPNLKKYLINKQIDDIISTVFRQTMFAEFEKICHHMAEINEPLTIDSLRSVYNKLLKKYFGPKVVIDPVADLEGLRIPHFYSAFYVYKYATGMSAAIALSVNVLSGGEDELKRYLDFLRSGGSKFPLSQLKDAGVDMSISGPVNSALKIFDGLVEKLEGYL